MRQPCLAGGDAHPTKRGIEGYRRLAVPADFFASIEDPRRAGTPILRRGGSKAIVGWPSRPTSSRASKIKDGRGRPSYEEELPACDSRA